MSTPAESLKGEVVNGRWRVMERLNADPNDSTGAYFSIPYRVEELDTGRQAFLKVLNLQKALQIYQFQGLGPTEALNRVTEAHLFECHLADACADKKMTRVVRGIDHGHTPIEIPGLGPVAHGYIVFEIGEHGDVHRLIRNAKSLDTSWTMKVLHQAAVGLQQLHSAQIAHQDLKRSNIIFFKPTESKLIDLGRAVKRDKPSNNDSREIPCQIMNSPPELIYGYTPADWGQRHFSTDLYMLGNLAFTMFFDVTLTTMLLSALPTELRPNRMKGMRIGGDYEGDYHVVIPFLRNALSALLAGNKDQIDASIRDKWVSTVSQLCEPDPATRGHPKDHAAKYSRKYSAERFISAFREMELRARCLS